MLPRNLLLLWMKYKKARAYEKLFWFCPVLLSLRFIFLLKLKWFANETWWITIQLNFSVYAWKPESFWAGPLTSILSTCQCQAGVGLDVKGRKKINQCEEREWGRERGNKKETILQNTIPMEQVKLISLVFEVLFYKQSICVSLPGREQETTNSICR